jgi:putative transposase
VAAGKKKAARLKAHLVFLDESGFQLLPHVCRTWAPRGQTPLYRQWQHRQRLAVISAVTVSPRRQRLGLYYEVHGKTIRHTEIERFLRHLLQHLRGPIVLLWDNGTCHKGPALAALRAQHPRLHLLRFPAYAPELNPDEAVWMLAKRRLANGCPADLDALLWDLTEVLEDVRHSPRLLRACLRHAALPRILNTA